MKKNYSNNVNQNYIATLNQVPENAANKYLHKG